MRLFRAIGFSNLHYAVTKPMRAKWATLANQARPQNWWMLPKYQNEVEQAIADVIHNNPSAVVTSSRSFSALQGGRFNAPKSHGALYCSENPLLAVLEVTYHTVVSTLANMRRIGKLEHQYSSAVNLQLPKRLHFRVVVFVLDAKVTNVWEPDHSLAALKDTCEQLGYARYTSENFDADFIFGNDYSITQIFGSFALSNGYHAIRVGTARLDGQRQYKNVVVLDGDSPVDLASDYYVFEVNAEPGSDGEPHEVQVARADRARGPKLEFVLANVPMRPSRKSSSVKSYPKDDADRIERSRQVTIQKFSMS